MGRISDYDIWEKDGILEDKLILIEGWKREGLSDEQIAHNLGISESSMDSYKKKYPRFLGAIKKGKEVVDFEVENALFKSAMEGNVTAQIFWLKNRKKNDWRDKVEYETNYDDLNKVKELLSKIENGVNNE